MHVWCSHVDSEQILIRQGEKVDHLLRVVDQTFRLSDVASRKHAIHDEFWTEIVVLAVEFDTKCVGLRTFLHGTSLQWRRVLCVPLPQMVHPTLVLLDDGFLPGITPVCPPLFWRGNAPFARSRAKRVSRPRWCSLLGAEAEHEKPLSSDAASWRARNKFGL